MSEEDLDAIGPDGQPIPAAARVDRDRRAPRFSWTPAYETTFFRSLCESVSLGLRENNSFKAEAWERAAASLQATHGAFPAKSHLINKSDNARKRFRLWRGLREDPDFLYNPVARTVTATEEAWRAHIEREPLSRALRGRPFDHEDFMEVLYPDVVGSGGAPKRIMKPRRRTDGAPIEDGDMPGTGIIQLQGDGTAILDSPGLEHRPLLSETPTGSSSGSLPSQNLAPMPSVSATSNSSALTPPDDVLPQASRKRRQQTNIYQAVSAEISPPLGISMPPQAQPPPPPPPPPPLSQPLTSASSSPHKRRRTSSRGTPSGAVPPLTLPPSIPAVAAAKDSTTSLQLPLMEELVDALKHRVTPRWREQALEIFFRDFSDEELDLQVKISENVLSNEHKSMMFCKMPLRVRQHWVSKFREMHQLNKTS